MGRFLEIASSAFGLLAMTGLMVSSVAVGVSLAAFTNIQTPEDKVLARAFAAFMDGNDKMALSYFEEVIRINPRNQAALKGLDKVKQRLKKIEDVEKAKARSLAKAKVKEGQGLVRTNDLVAAVDSFHAATDAVPDYKPAKKELARIKARMSKTLAKKQLNLSNWSFARGVVAYLDKDWAKAYRIWSERLKLEPHNVVLANATARSENNFRRMMMAEQIDFHRRGARAFYEQGYYAQAKASWEKVLTLRTEDLEALEGKARSEKAILQAQGVGRDNQIHDLLEQGLDAYASQNWVKARSIFQQLVQVDPEFSTAKEYIAKINEQLSSSSYQPAGVASNQSWRGSRSSNQGTDIQMPDKVGNFVDSRKELESQLQRDPSNIRVQQELDRVVRAQEEESERIYKDGLIAYSQGNRGLAVQYWKQVLVIHPEHKKASAALKKALAEEERLASEPEKQ